MSIGQITRKIQSYVRNMERQRQEKATFDWQLANLIGISVGRCLSNEIEMPSLEEAYSYIFISKEEEKEEIKEKEPQQKNVKLSVARFLQFASQHNLKVKKEVLNNDG